MMRISVEVVGLDRLAARLERLDANARRKVLGDGLEAGARLIERNAKLSIQSTSKHGREYIVQGRRHRASAPGEAPATDTGHLVNSIFVQRGSMEAVVGVGAEYAAYLEYGTSRMAPRPFMRPAVDNHMPEIRRAIEGAVERGLGQRL